MNTPQAAAVGNQLVIPFNPGKVSLWLGVALAIAGLVLMFYGPSPARIEQMGGEYVTIRTSTSGYGLALVVGLVAAFLGLLSYNTLCAQYAMIKDLQSSLEVLTNRVELLASHAEQAPQRLPAYRENQSPFPTADIPPPPPSHQPASAAVLGDDVEGAGEGQEQVGGGGDVGHLFRAPSEDAARDQIREALGGQPPSAEQRSARPLGDPSSLP